MRLSTASITVNTEIRRGVHLIEMHAPQLAQAAQPGQYCMVRCCDRVASDPLLRRPFFVHTVRRERGLCTLLVHVRGRGTAWLVKQQEGASLDILGPLGQGFGSLSFRVKRAEISIRRPPTGYAAAGCLGCDSHSLGA